jgi:hypothetical protein
MYFDPLRTTVTLFSSDFEPIGDGKVSTGKSGT